MPWISENALVDKAKKLARTSSPSLGERANPSLGLLFAAADARRALTGPDYDRLLLCSASSRVIRQQTGESLASRCDLGVSRLRNIFCISFVARGPVPTTDTRLCRWRHCLVLRLSLGNAFVENRQTIFHSPHHFCFSGKMAPGGTGM